MSTTYAKKINIIDFLIFKLYYIGLKNDNMLPSRH